jgi:flagellar biosynthesis/type III secretory pathway protein FliH
MMKTLSVHLEMPLKSVEVFNGYKVNSELSPGIKTADKAEQNKLIVELEAEKNLFFDANQTLNSLVAKLENLYQDIFKSHNEQIAKLSVEIARKVLMHKVSDGDYEIESIVKEVIASAPSKQEIVIYLNPHDLAACQKAGKEGAFEGIKFEADSSINRAECRLQSPKGIIKSLIAEHLDQIEKTLLKTE